MEAVSLKESCTAAIEEVANVGFGPFAKLCKGHYLRIADLGADRSEGPVSALRVEMCMVQQFDRSPIYHCHSRP
jgi:hypothetical protein